MEELKSFDGVSENTKISCSKTGYQFYDSIKKMNQKIKNTLNSMSLEDSNLELGDRIELRIGLGSPMEPFIEYRGEIVYLDDNTVKIEYKGEDDDGYTYTANCDADISSLILGYIVDDKIVPFKRITKLGKEYYDRIPLEISGKEVNPFTIKNFEKINFLKSNACKGSIVRITTDKNKEFIGTPDNIFEDKFSVYSIPLTPHSDLYGRVDRDKYFLGDYRIEVQTEDGFKDVTFFD